MHPLSPKDEGIAEWEKICGTKSRRGQISRMGMDSQTAEELFIKYGNGPLHSRPLMFEMLFILKNDPSFDNGAWATHSSNDHKTVWRNFWNALSFLNEVFWKGIFPV